MIDEALLQPASIVGRASAITMLPRPTSGGAVALTEQI
jgi:hypothetical protein